MATITIRNLDEKIKRRLQVRAALNGRSMEAEARELLAELVRDSPDPGIQKTGLGTAIHNLFAPLGGVDLKTPPREFSTRPVPDFRQDAVEELQQTEGLGALGAEREEDFGTAASKLFAPVWTRTFEEERKKHLPDQIKLLFLAEAPPRLQFNRFFYFAEVKTGDTLFLETMKVLYPSLTGFAERTEIQKARFFPKEVRARKAYFLDRFRDDGFYLADAIENPMPSGANSSTKMRTIRESLPALIGKLSHLCHDRQTPIILIGDPVYKVCATALREANLRILNEESINMPALGGQVQFRSKLRHLLCVHQIASSDAAPN
jgi:plasmid stability protein